MDALGPTPPVPGREPGDTPATSGDPGTAPPQSAARARRSTAEWLWSRRLPARTATRSRRGKVTVGLLALALAAGGGVAIAATTDAATDTPSPSTSPDGNVKGEKGDVIKRALPFKMGMLGHGGMVHGEFTVPDGDGGYRTMITQNGTISTVDGNRLTVKSADGWTKDYTLDTSTLVGGQRYWSADGNGGLTEGQEVLVTATVKDGAAHADHVRTRLDKAELEKRAGELKQRLGDRMEMFGGERGERIFKFRGGPGGHMGMPGMPGMDGELHVRPAPEAGTASGTAVPAPAPDVQPGTFAEPAEDFTVLVS